jgi:hypothetical protein
MDVEVKPGPSVAITCPNDGTTGMSECNDVQDWLRNLKVSLCLTKHHTMKTYWGSEGIGPRIL